MSPHEDWREIGGPDALDAVIPPAPSTPACRGCSRCARGPSSG